MLFTIAIADAEASRRCDRLYQRRLA